MSKPKRWSLNGFIRYRELHKRNYELDDLWGPNPNQCSNEFSEFVDLQQFYQGIDNTQMVIDLVVSLEKEVAAIRAEPVNHDKADAIRKGRAADDRITNLQMSLDCKAQRLSLAEQDRESWKRNFITTRDAGSAHIASLEARAAGLSEALQRLEKSVRHHNPYDADTRRDLAAALSNAAAALASCRESAGGEK